MILVDTSVWIDYFRGVRSPETDRLDDLLILRRICTGDLIVAEVLQGYDTDREFNRAKKLLNSVDVFELCGLEVAINAAVNYRKLRSRGVTVRKSIDTIIATYCMEHGHELLFSDRDFDPFVAYLGLRSALTKLRGP